MGRDKFNYKKWREENREIINKRKRKWYRKNHKKVAEASRQYRKNNLEKCIERDLKRKYKITLKDYSVLLENQKGCCAICNQPPQKKKLSVDHDHNDGRVRGLLCYICNTALGWFEKNRDQTLKYLERPFDK